MWTRLDQALTRDIPLTAIIHGDSHGDEQVLITVRNGDSVLESISMALDIRPAGITHATFVNAAVPGSREPREVSLSFDIDRAPSRWMHLEMQDNSTVHVWRAPVPSLGEKDLLPLWLKSHPGLFLADADVFQEERGTKVIHLLHPAPWWHSPIPKPRGGSIAPSLTPF